MQKNYYADNNSYLDNKNKLFDNLSMIEKDSDGNAIVRTCNCDDLTKTNSYYESALVPPQRASFPRPHPPNC